VGSQAKADKSQKKTQKTTSDVYFDSTVVGSPLEESEEQPDEDVDGEEEEPVVA
jgi:hypothetical protein